MSAHSDLRLCACVVLDKVLDMALDYLVPAQQQVEVGMRVLVPLRGVLHKGTVVQLKQGSEIKTLQPIREILTDRGLLAPDLLALAHWISNYYAAPLRRVFEQMLPKEIRNATYEESEQNPMWQQEFFKTEPKPLNAEQAEALRRIQNSLDAKRFDTHLLYGVTGSGKTEIYIQAIAHTLAQKRSSLLLVPEIALTSQTVEQLRSRFDEKIVLLHHRITPKQRAQAWHQIRNGQVPIVVGARSALFSPLPHLGLLIVDEEHESSYKSSEMPCIHARDAALVRAKLAQATVILGSATPSLESFYNAQKGKYILSRLSHRVNSPLPTCYIVDMKPEFAKQRGFTLFSEMLIQKIKERTEVGEQSLLFLNRRGYHTSQICLACSHVLRCPHCDMSLTYHLGEALLACHLCDYRLSPLPRACPQCGQTNHLKYKGAGTELVQRNLQALLPEIRIMRLDADTTRRKGQQEQLLRQFRAGKADVLIGTQMIAKGLHFPSVTLAAILHVDGTLSVPDFRAQEIGFRLLTQVAGRAGRGETPGEVIMQTHLPHQSTILLAQRQDYEAFFHSEIQVRQRFRFPPFSHLVKLTFTGKDERATYQQAQEVRGRLLTLLPPTFEIHPLIPCSHVKIQDQFRFQLLLKTDKPPTMRPLLQPLKQLKGGVRLHVDVDPICTF